MEGQTIGTMVTMLISRVVALGEAEAMVVIPRSHTGVLGMVGIPGTEVELSIGKELVMMTTDGERFVKEGLIILQAGEGIIIEETNLKEKAATRKVIGQVRGMETRVGNNLKPQGLAVNIMAGAEVGMVATGEVQDGMRGEAQVGTMMEFRGEPS